MALLLSRCYYLLDGNSINPYTLKSISQRIMKFVRGRNSIMPYSFLEAPRHEGGMDCPSLTSRYHAYNLKFLGDIISGDPKILWKVWTQADLRYASFPSSAGAQPHLNPLAQHAHTFVLRLEPRLRAAYKSAWLLGIDLDTCFPSPAARLDAPALFHPAVPVMKYHRAKCPKTGKRDFHGVRRICDIVTPPPPLLRCKYCMRQTRLILAELRGSVWDPVHPSFHTCLPDNIKIWPAMDRYRHCLRVFSLPRNLFSIAPSSRQRNAVDPNRDRSVRRIHSSRYSPPDIPLDNFYKPPLGILTSVVSIW